MEKKKTESDPFWGSSQKGFDFEDVEPPIGNLKLSAVMRENDELNQFDLMRCDGLSEVAENVSSEEFLAFNISRVENEMHASKLAKTFNPLEIEINQTIPSNKFTCGPEQTVKHMIFGVEYSLEKYKKKSEKADLLYEAVKSHDGNIILEVVLFLRDTLKPSIFHREIMSHPDAVNVYLSYLEEDHKMDELSNMLLLLGKTEDAAILNYEYAVTVQQPERKLKWIENCLSTHFLPGATSLFLRRSLEEHKQLICDQMKLERHYITCNRTDSILLFVKLCNKQSVIDSSVLDSLMFCYLYFHKTYEPNFASPVKIKATYNLSKKQFTWAALKALAASNRWSDIDELFASKNWLGGVKFRSCISFSRLLEVLFKAKAPKEVLNKYISCVENDSEKLLLAKNYGCHGVALEVFKNNKDKRGLLEYQSMLLPHSVDYLNTLDLLNNPTIKWKN